MNIDKILEIRLKQKGLSDVLGMEFMSTPEPDTCMAQMHVDERNRQPFGFLSGGATLALAENLAGVGSMALCPGKICVGINVSGNHV
ncbi:MAG: PaaI family thioesterase, partial [Alloprevotella sp.]